MAPRRHARRGAADRIRPHETHGRYPTTPARGTNQPSTRSGREEAGKSAVTSGGRSRSRRTGGRSRMRNSCCRRNSCCSRRRAAVAIPATISTISAVAVVISGGCLGGGEAGCAERGDGGDCDEGFLEGVHVHVLRVRCRTVRRDQREKHHPAPPP